MSYTTPLLPNTYYHVFNRGNNGENIFREETNYHYFLSQYTKYLTPNVDTYTYCLLRNHFHLLIRVHDNGKDTEQHVSKAFSNFFNAYAKAFNKQYKRHGTLFERPFKRKPIKTQAHLIQCVYYIHENPVKHIFVERRENWPYSSYSAYMTEKQSKINKEECLSWFDNLQGFIDYHEFMTLDKIDRDLDFNALDE